MTSSRLRRERTLAIACTKTCNNNARNVYFFEEKGSCARAAAAAAAAAAACTGIQTEFSILSVA
jgi:hypothetical protein